MQNFHSPLTTAAIALTLVAAICACSGGAAPNNQSPPLASGQSVASSASMRSARSRAAEARAFLQTNDSTDDWEAGTPMAGNPNEVQLSDGEIVNPPPDDVPTKDCGFVGYVPPACTTTGAFRRFYSQPGASFMEGTWDVSPSTNLPTPPPAKVAGAGYVYTEGWPTSNLSAPSEAGFAYVAQKKWFYAYLKTPGGAMYNKKRWASSTSQQLDIQLYGSASGQVSAVFTGTCFTPAPNGNTACTSAMNTPDPGWNATGCCVVASMVTIAEPPPGGIFNNGFIWGPADQVDCSSMQPPAVPGNCSVPGLMDAGQRYPNNTSKIIVKEPVFPGTESDTINLHP
jgi:hypothetical protein